LRWKMTSRPLARVCFVNRKLVLAVESIMGDWSTARGCRDCGSQNDEYKSNIRYITPPGNQTEFRWGNRPLKYLRITSENEIRAAGRSVCSLLRNADDTIPRTAATNDRHPARSREPGVPSGSRSDLPGNSMARGPIFKFARSCGEPPDSAIQAARSRAPELSNKVRL
jgi:hypothetical protein